MPLVNTEAILRRARETGTAVAAFNVHNLETIQAVAEAAAEEQAPVIIQTTPGTLDHAGLPYVAAIVAEAGRQFAMPIVLQVDHCRSFATIGECLRHGYTSVMIDASHLPYEENVTLVRRVVEAAHAAGATVEGELGRIGGTEDHLTTEEWEAALTIPEQARDFAAATGLDSLAVAIGTAHGEYRGEPHLDLDRLAAIRALTEVPLVLHGATGVPEDLVRAAIARGICKVNIATDLKIAMARAIQECWKRNPHEYDPRIYLGAAKRAIKERAREIIRICGARR